jgi:hypothetical protein
MDIAVYCGKWILPAKNGTRYLDKIFTPKTQGNLQDLLSDTLNGNEFKSKYVIYSEDLYFLSETNVTHLFLRDPYSQLYSAIYTDLWGHTSLKDKKIGLSKENTNLLKSIYSYTSNGTGHWVCDLYQSLFWLLKKKPDIIVLPLSELTSFMESIGYKEKYNPTDYNFKNLQHDENFHQLNNISRKEVIDWLKLYHPHIWNNIIELLQKDIPYYNRIIKGDFKMDLPKIKKLSIEDTKNILFPANSKKFL